MSTGAQEPGGSDECSVQIDGGHRPPEPVVESGVLRRGSSLLSTVGLWFALVALAAATARVCKVAFAAPQHTDIAAPGSGVGTVMDSAVPSDISHLPLVDQDGRATDLAASRARR